MKKNNWGGIAALTALLLTADAWSCSICRCGDPTFNALGKEGVALAGVRIALDWDRVEKTQGVADEKERLTENRATLLAAYGINDSVSIFARLPYSWRTLRSEVPDGDKLSTSGLADPEIYGQVRLWSSQFDGDVGVRTAVYVVAGVKTSWGQNNLSRNGERLEEHVQPGTGSTDEFAGLAASYQINRTSALFASTQFRKTGRNDAGYRYGNVWLANLAYEHKLSARVDAVIEANYRHAKRDEIDGSGELDPDTGGAILYLTPRLLFDLGHGWVVRGTVQIPTSQHGLYGEQTEKTVFNVGLTKLFAR